LVDSEPDGTVQERDAVSARAVRASRARLLRKRKEVAYTSSVAVIEALSVLANSKHYKSLSDFFRSRRLRGRVEENAVGGDDPQHYIQIEKTIGFDELNKPIDERKGRRRSWADVKL